MGVRIRTPRIAAQGLSLLPGEGEKPGHFSTCGEALAYNKTQEAAPGSNNHGSLTSPSTLARLADGFGLKK